MRDVVRRINVGGKQEGMHKDRSLALLKAGISKESNKLKIKAMQCYSVMPPVTTDGTVFLF